MLGVLPRTTSSDSGRDDSSYIHAKGLLDYAWMGNTQVSPGRCICALRRIGQQSDQGLHLILVEDKHLLLHNKGGDDASVAPISAFMTSLDRSRDEIRDLQPS